MSDALAAEWIKLRTVRSTPVILAVVLALCGAALLLVVYFVVTYDSLPPEGRARSALSPMGPLVEMVASLAMAVLGMLAITSEHATGMIRATYAAIPDRRRVLAAKAAVVGAVALVTGQVTVLGTAALEKLIVAGRPIRGQSAQSIAEQLPHILAMGLMVAVFALFGLGLGAILRSTPGALSTLAGLWYVLPIVVNNLPEPWHEWVGSVLPGALAGQLAGTGNPNSVYGSSLPPAAALAVMAAYAVVPLAVAVHLDRRRDT